MLHDEIAYTRHIISRDISAVPRKSMSTCKVLLMYNTEGLYIA